MNSYELMVKANYYLIKGGTLTQRQSEKIVNQLLASISSDTVARNFYRSVRYPDNSDKNGHKMYPLYFIPPYNNGMKLKTLLSQTPKTHILAANSYELEILRLLVLLTVNNDAVKEMTAQTLARLRTTCFGNEDDGVGECYETSLIVLRFLAAAAPHETVWIKERLTNYHKYYDSKHRHWSVKWYYLLCLSELPVCIAEQELKCLKAELLEQLNSGYPMKTENAKTFHPILLCILRNCLSRLPEYEYLSNNIPKVNEADGRLQLQVASVFEPIH